MQEARAGRRELGEHVFDFFLRNKREDGQDYRRQVTEYQPTRYLPVL